MKCPGNEKQVAFNLSIVNILWDIKDLVFDDQLRQTDRREEETIGMLNHRNKLIHLADRSSLGWDTVQDYKEDDLEDDSAKERRMTGAKSRAATKRGRSATNSPLAGWINHTEWAEAIFNPLCPAIRGIGFGMPLRDNPFRLICVVFISNLAGQSSPG